MLELPTYSDVKSAQIRLQGHAIRTPLVSSTHLNTMCGYNLFLKNETKQVTGTFKYRGARSRMSLLSSEELERGVVAFSSGNHAQGVAFNARELGTTSIIVMPKSAPQKKKDGTKALGADIVEYDIATENREQIAERIASETGRILVPAFDDKYVIAGQGTCALEICEQAKEQGAHLDAVITPMGGGGLGAGTSLAVKHLAPQAQIYGVEPAGFDDQRRSLLSGRRERILKGGRTLCDALMSPKPGVLTFAINKRALMDIFVVTDEMVLKTIAVVYSDLGIKLEPGGAAALASILYGDTPFKPGANIAVILSGGNVDDEIFDLAIRTTTEIMHEF
ncbi:MAG TPA: threonine/serine dehydratase [Hellea balneolensis]|uniref:Threonine/serine dehydratase n=1 Tax=Hellea balneolensis TaxID=287478 RepID=A0A7C5QW95_9PROT|nr:threonine/serine dehydratase [Hellea balneolensis]